MSCGHVRPVPASPFPGAHAEHLFRPPCRRQDQDLDDIEQAVIRIGRQGREIGNELEEQVGRLRRVAAGAAVQPSCAVGLVNYSCCCWIWALGEGA